MKCPFCQKKLRKIHPTYVICDNCRITGADKLWQALDVAVDALARIIHDDTIIHGSTMMQVSQKALDQIKQITETKG